MENSLTVRSPDDIFLVTAGSPGAGWSAYIPTWAPTIHSSASSEKSAASSGGGLP